MYKKYFIPITLICSLYISAAIAQNFDPKLKDPAYWKDEIAESIATTIVNQIPDMVEEQNIEREKIENSTDNAYIAKLKERFFAFVEGNKMNQARIISNMMAKRGDDTGERYLQSLE